MMESVDVETHLPADTQYLGRDVLEGPTPFTSEAHAVAEGAGEV